MPTPRANTLPRPQVEPEDSTRREKKEDSRPKEVEPKPRPRAPPALPTPAAAAPPVSGRAGTRPGLPAELTRFGLIRLQVHPAGHRAVGINPSRYLVFVKSDSRWVYSRFLPRPTRRSSSLEIAFRKELVAVREGSTVRLWDLRRRPGRDVQTRRATHTLSWLLLLEHRRRLEGP